MSQRIILTAQWVHDVNDSIVRLIRLPDLVTLLNSLLGLTAILMVIQDPSNILKASLLTVLAVMADGLDGVIARKMENGVLGVHLDSLADIISFGVAPVAIAYSVMLSRYHYLICIIGGTFLVCGVLRLARFNAIGSGNGFIGIPITTSGLAVPLYLLVFDEYDSSLFYYGLLALMLLLAGLMVSSVPYEKIRDYRVYAVAGSLLVIMILAFSLEMMKLTKIFAGINLIWIGVYIISPILRLRQCYSTQGT